MALIEQHHLAKEIALADFMFLSVSLVAGKHHRLTLQEKIGVERLLSLLEPIMILVMGVAVGFIVLAILLPIFQASQGIG